MHLLTDLETVFEISGSSGSTAVMFQERWHNIWCKHSYISSLHLGQERQFLCVLVTHVVVDIWCSNYVLMSLASVMQVRTAALPDNGDVDWNWHIHRVLHLAYQACKIICFFVTPEFKAFWLYHDTLEWDHQNCFVCDLGLFWCLTFVAAVIQIIRTPVFSRLSITTCQWMFISYNQYR